MREIRFRAWNKDTKSMDYNPTIDGFEVGIVALNSFAYQHSSKIILMQSTGLKDKNGFEIYEGDILKTNGGNFYVKEALPFITLVKNEPPDEYEYDNGDYYQGGNIKMHDWDRFEVIGNIYENSELLD